MLSPEQEAEIRQWALSRSYAELVGAYTLGEAEIERLREEVAAGGRALHDANVSIGQQKQRADLAEQAIRDALAPERGTRADRYNGLGERRWNILRAGLGE